MIERLRKITDEKLSILSKIDGNEKRFEREEYELFKGTLKIIISWDDEYGGMVYHIREPHLEDGEKKLAGKVIDFIEETIDIDVSEEELERREFIEKKIDSFEKVKIKLEPETRKKIYYHIFSETIGFGKLTPLLEDKNISSFKCSGYGAHVFCMHENFGELKTNLLLPAEKLDSIILKLSQRIGGVYNQSSSEAGGSLPGGLKIDVSFREGSDSGPSFSVRKES